MDGSPASLAYPCNKFCSLPPGGRDGYYSVCGNARRQLRHSIVPKSGVSHTRGRSEPNGWYAIDEKRVVSIRSLPELRVLTYYDQTVPEVIVVLARSAEPTAAPHENGFFEIAPRGTDQMRTVDPGIGIRERMAIRFRGSMIVASVDHGQNMKVRRISSGQLDLMLHVLSNEKDILQGYLDTHQGPIVTDEMHRDEFGGQRLTLVGKDLAVLHQCVSWTRTVMISSVTTSDDQRYLTDQENDQSLVNL